MPAAQIWALENRRRYVCKACDYSTHNRAIFRRHGDTRNHWLRTIFALDAPRDIRVIVGSFLPFMKLRASGDVGIDAHNHGLAPDSIWRLIVDPEDPLSRIYVWAARLRRN